MDSVEKLAGDWEDIADFQLPVRPENAITIRLLSAEISQRLTSLPGNWNFDFQFNLGGVLQVREKEPREGITRISLSVRRIHGTIRNLLAEVAPELSPPPHYQSVPYSFEAQSNSTSEVRVASQKSKFGITEFLRRWLRPWKRPETEVDPATIRREIRERVFRFFDRSDQLVQLQSLTQWLEDVENAGQLVPLIEAAKSRWL